MRETANETDGGDLQCLTLIRFLDFVSIRVLRYPKNGVVRVRGFVWLHIVIYSEGLLRPCARRSLGNGGTAPSLAADCIGHGRRREGAREH